MAIRYSYICAIPKIADALNLRLPTHPPASIRQIAGYAPARLAAFLQPNLLSRALE